MDILNNLNEQYELISSETASSEKEIQQLIEFSDIEVPEEYLSMLRQQTDLTILVKNCKYERYVYINNAAVCIDMNKSLEMKRWIPNSLAFSDDGGDMILFYATGQNGFGVYAVEGGALNIKYAIYLSESLESLLVRADGIDNVRYKLFNG